MNIAEAQAFSDGLEFYAHQKNITLRVTRDYTGNIVINKYNYIKDFERKKNKPITNILIFCVSLLFTIFSTIFHVNLITFLAFIWMVTFAYFFISSKNPDNASMHKYHASEHKVLNYMDKYNTYPENYHEVMKMPSLSIRCGTTLVAVVYVFVTLIILGISFIPGILLKILWCLFSIYLTLYFWANGFCYFFQKMVIKEPSDSEVELATIALCEYKKICDNNC